MITDLKPYPAMKDSGVKWLGNVPEHWEVRRVRNVAEMRISNVDKHTIESEQPIRLCNYVDVYKNDYIGPNMPFMQATATKEEITRFHLVAGDVLITKDSEAWDDIGVPALVVESANDLVCGYHLALLRPFDNRLMGGYLLHALQSRGIRSQFHIKANGVTRYGLSYGAIKSVSVPVPSLLEQIAIAWFLDRINRRIRRYIRAKQKLIALLEEQNQTVMHEAVTGRIDVRTSRSYLAYKDSGVEWLGRVPKHWETRRLKSIARLRYGLGQPPQEIKDGLPLLRATNVDHGRILETNLVYIDPFDVPKGRDTFLTKDEIIVVRSGAYTADSAIVTEAYDGAVAGYDMIVTVTGAVPEFIATALLCEYVRDDQLVIASTRFAQPHINAEELGTAVFLIPSLPEQTAILRYLAKARATIGTAIERAHREIALLREYRTRLIADVVTGKLDVREAAARLPEVDPLGEDHIEGPVHGDAGSDLGEVDAAQEVNL